MNRPVYSLPNVRDLCNIDRLNRRKESWLKFGCSLEITLRQELDRDRDCLTWSSALHIVEQNPLLRPVPLCLRSMSAPGSSSGSMRLSLDKALLKSSRGLTSGFDLGRGCLGRPI